MIRFCLNAIFNRLNPNKQPSNPQNTSSKKSTGCCEFFKRKNQPNQKDDPNLSQVISKEDISTSLSALENSIPVDQAIFEENIGPLSNKNYLSEKFQALKLAHSMPGNYITQYFADLINKVEIAFEMFLKSQADGTNEMCRQAKNDQIEIIKAIRDHGRECLENMQDSEFEKGLSGQIMGKIMEIGVRLVGELSVESIMEISEEIRDTLVILERKIFMNKGVCFLNGGDLRIDEWRRKKESSLKSIGVLVFIEDELSPREDLVKR